MAPDPNQALADADEADARARYQRHRQLAELLHEAAERADAMSRLEASLRYKFDLPRAA